MVKIQVDFRFVDIEYDLYSLQLFRSTFEKQLRSTRKLEYNKLKKRLTKDGQELDDHERQFEEEEVRYVVDEILPRFFRGPYLIALWALLESGLIDLASYLVKRDSLGLRLSDIRGHDPIERWEKYFSHVAICPLGISENDRKRFRELNVVRNAFAHANGRLEHVLFNLGHIPLP